MIGLGSVQDTPTAALFMQMGAKTRSGSLHWTLKWRRYATGGKCCGSELRNRDRDLTGRGLGAEIVKIFPGIAAGGPSFVKAVKGPRPWTSFMPTRGCGTHGRKTLADGSPRCHLRRYGLSSGDRQVRQEATGRGLEMIVQNTISLIGRLGKPTDKPGTGTV